jgi:hypothetical protein
VQDLAATAVGAVAFYALGFAHGACFRARKASESFFACLRSARVLRRTRCAAGPSCAAGGAGRVPAQRAEWAREARIGTFFSVAEGAPVVQSPPTPHPPPPPLPPSSPCAAHEIGIRSPHRLGVWLAVPAVLIGLSFGAQKGYYRYLGFTANGHPSLYPDYKEDMTPYFVKHRTSDRHFDAPSGTLLKGDKELK